MFKLFLGMTFVFVIGSVMSALFSGESFASSTLTSAITNSSDLTVLPVTSGSDYLNPGGSGAEVIIIENEVFNYTNIELTIDANCPNPAGGNFSAPCLTGVTRSHNSTDAREHPNGAVVYGQMMGVINMLLSFDVAKNTINIAGVLNTPIPSPLALIQAITPIVMMDYAFLDIVQILKIFAQLFGLAFVAVMLFAFLTTVRGLLT